MGEARDIAAILKNVAEYGDSLAAVFHNYALIAEKLPRGFEGTINILDATVTVLRQILSLVEDEAAGKKLFSEESLAYTLLLAKQSANTIAKVEPIISNACLERKERNAKRKQNKKAAAKGLITDVNPLALKLEEKGFLDKVENARWSLATKDIDGCMDRLYELQLHLLLVFKVVKVGAAVKDSASGRVDIHSIVISHSRIKRIAALVGIKAPNSRSTTRRRNSFTSYDSYSSSDSDSDASTFVGKMKKKPLPATTYPPPPPQATRLAAGPPPPTFIPVKAQDPEVNIVDDAPTTNSNPPAYSETKAKDKIPSSPVSWSRHALPMLSSSRATERQAKPTVYPDEKVSLKEKAEPAKAEESEDIVKPSIPEGRLFKASSNKLGFKLKSFFRSKESLAVEMKRTLINSSSQLVAYVVQQDEHRQIPHSAFHTLEMTHMRTILSQLNSNDWFKTFSGVSTLENATISSLLKPSVDGKIDEREIVVLKVLEENRFNAWLALLGEFLKNRPFPSKGRVILIIMREKFADGKPLQTICSRLGPPPPPGIISICPPQMPYSPPKRTFISDLTFGPVTHPLAMPAIQLSQGHPPGPPPPPSSTSFSPRLPPPPPPSSLPLPPLRVRCDNPQVTEVSATAALTTYNEYTMRPSEPNDPSGTRSWSRAAITQESSERHTILRRVEMFKLGGGNVLETKLRLTEHQSIQVTRLMDDLKCTERDSRFEWMWVEMSLFNNGTTITNFVPKSNAPSTTGDYIASKATLIHLVAKRSLRPACNAVSVYNGLMRPPPPPRPPVLGPPISITPRRSRKSRYVDSSTDSGYDTTYSSSDSSVGNVRRRLRRYREKKTRRNRKVCRDSSSDSNSDSESEEEDVIAVKVELKRGDDVVKVLLDRWTPEDDGRVKGKEVTA